MGNLAALIDLLDKVLRAARRTEGAHVMGAERICGHCELPLRGHARAGETWLCHPDQGRDCYHLVTVYRHPTPCPKCAGQVAMLTLE